MQTRIFLIRGVAALAWAAAFATASDSLTTGTAILLVLYPVIDLVATIIDARCGQASTRRVLALNAVVSAAAAIAIAGAATEGAGSVLGVFGAWAAATGAAQLITAVRRRKTFGNQWPMLVAGALSTIGGISFTLSATGPDVSLDPLTLYAAAGGAFFVIQAWILRRRLRRASAAPTTSTVTTNQLQGANA